MGGMRQCTERRNAASVVAACRSGSAAGSGSARRFELTCGRIEKKKLKLPNIKHGFLCTRRCVTTYINKYKYTFIFYINYTGDEPRQQDTLANICRSYSDSCWYIIRSMYVCTDMREPFSIACIPRWTTSRRTVAHVCLEVSPGLHNTPGSARVLGLILYVLFCVY